MEAELRSHPLQTEPLKGFSVLLVDDSTDYTAMMSMRLKKFGANVDVVNDGFKSLEIVKTKSYDVILMDIQMPGIDGLKVISKMRESGIRSPIITVTALKDIVKLSPQQTREISAHAGKPTDIPDLVETILGVIAIRDL